MNALRNKVVLIGNLGQDPEILETENGSKRARFSVATNETYRDASGEKVTETQWHQVVAWGKTAEACNQYLQKGDQVMVEGELQPDPETGGPKVFSRRDGTAGASYEMRANRVKFGSKSRRNGGGRLQQATVATEGGRAKADTEADDDIPW